MKKNVNPAVVIAAIIVVLAVVGYFGYHAVAPPQGITGIMNGKPMTAEQGEALKQKMMGAQGYQKK